MDYYSPPNLAKLLGVNPSTIKRWVDKGLLEAQKTPGGHRRVSAEALSKFISSQKNLADFSYVIKRLSRAKDIPADLDWEGYYNFLLKNTNLSSQNLLEEQFLRGTAILEIIEKIVLPVLVEVGQAWVKGQISIYDEHRMAFLLRSDLLRLERMLPHIQSASAPLAVLACVKDENHEIPLLLLHLLLKQKGWQTIILGINTPAKEAAKAAVQNRAQMLCLTKSFSKIKEQEYLASLKKELKGFKVTVALGGAGWKITQLERFGCKRYQSLRAFLKTLKPTQLDRRVGKNRKS